MMKGLEGKVALVTGGGSPFGRACALALAARGARIVVAGRGEKALGEAVGEIVFGGGKARHVVADTAALGGMEAPIAKALEVFGRLDLVVANAAGDPVDPEAIIHTGLVGTHRTFAAALARLEDGGRLVATCGRVTRGPAEPAEAATREGLGGLVRALAAELAPRRIRCNSLVKTAGRADDRPSAEAEAAEVVAFLCSAAGDAVSGQVLALG